MTIEPIVTRVAHTGADELRFRGHRVFAQLLGNMSTAQMLLLGIGGRILDQADAEIVDDIVTAMSSADPRLWPFKVTRLASSYGGAASAIAATLIAGEGGMYGTNRLASAARWLVDVERNANGAALTDEAMLAILRAGAQGFGVLYRAHDERFAALIRQVERRHRATRRHWQRCLHAVRVAREQLQVEAHVYLGISALCLDLGLTPDAIAMFALLLLFHDGLPNAIEGAQQRPPCLRSLDVETLDYRGVPARRSPRAT